MWAVDEVEVVATSSIERVYRESGDRLWWSLLAFTGDPEAASDAVAEAFARALSAADEIREPRAWVWKVAFRVATTELRRSRRDVGGSEDRPYEMDVTTIAVTQALSRLSTRQRAVIVLYYLEGRPANDIADVLGMSAATVSVHLHRARRNLRSILGDDDA
jgi:RNA polymerase sigma factor (sigma-70 family)